MCITYNVESLGAKFPDPQIVRFLTNLAEFLSLMGQSRNYAELRCNAYGE